MEAGKSIKPMALRGSIQASAAESVMSMTRRTACSMGVALSAAALIGMRPADALAAGRADIRYVVTDCRFPQSMEFGTVLTRQGSTRLEVTEGLTSLWRDALAPLWEGKQGAVTGLTEVGSWRCLAEQARSRGRKTVFVGRHAASGPGSAEHLLSASPAMLKEAAAVATCGEAWPRVMATLAARCSDTIPPSSHQRFQSRGKMTGVAPPALVSWIIA